MTEKYATYQEDEGLLHFTASMPVGQGDDNVTEDMQDSMGPTAINSNQSINDRLWGRRHHHRYQYQSITLPY